MNRITGFLRAAYNFFAGNVILITAVAVAFVLGALLTHADHIAGVVPGVVFVAAIVLGLLTTLGREVAGRPRQR